MKSTTTGTSYVYERVNGIIYAREHGKTERHVHSYMKDSYAENMTLEYELETVWKHIIKESRSNSTLQAELDRVKILYHLSKEKYGTK